MKYDCYKPAFAVEVKNSNVSVTFKPYPSYFNGTQYKVALSRDDFYTSELVNVTDAKVTDFLLCS